jgi:NADPH:quinone reductase-like Zn-dependent oxidoreductase
MPAAIVDWWWPRCHTIAVARSLRHAPPDRSRMTKAAVLHALGEAPSYEGFAEPKPNKDETLVSVRAASLKNSDKMMADGSHYDSLRQLPAVVGLDGVGVLEDGTRVYCAGPRPPYGTMAEKTVVPRAFCLPVPDAVDDLTAAALPNPAIASWLSLEWKARLEPGETVLILGATGVAGRLAVQLPGTSGLDASSAQDVTRKRWRHYMASALTPRSASKVRTMSWRRRSPIRRGTAATTWSSIIYGAARRRRWLPPSRATT